jgi:hypothetical protein
MKKENEEHYDHLVNDLKENGAVLMYIDNGGNITLLTTGDITKVQSNITERMLAAARPSLVLSLILFVEISIVKFEDKLAAFLKKLFRRV